MADTSSSVETELERRVRSIEPKVIEWRRTVHQRPELSNREFETAKLVAKQLTRLGFEVRTGIAHTGVVGVLRGAKPGPMVALRADMDALPVTEVADVPFKSTVRTSYRGEETGVMHACGHDAHVAIVLGAAEVLASMRDKLAGSVMFIFQPAEEGAPAGEQGGARLMLAEGLFAGVMPSAIFGLHVWPDPVGTLSYRSGPAMAASDKLSITVRGKQTHGGQPWGGVDSIVVSAQILLGLQTIVSRQVDISQTPAVVTIGSIHAGNRGNIIPEQTVMEGTIRTFDAPTRALVHERVRQTATMIAKSAGATVDVDIERNNPGVNNDASLTESMLPTLRRVVGADNVRVASLSTGSEDFGDFQKQAPGLFLFLGVVPKGQDASKAPRNHSPSFFVDESALALGVRVLSSLTLDWLDAHRSVAAR